MLAFEVLAATRNIASLAMPIGSDRISSIKVGRVRIYARGFVSSCRTGEIVSGVS
jgi:hypothetical protein